MIELSAKVKGERENETGERDKTRQEEGVYKEERDERWKQRNGRQTRQETKRGGAETEGERDKRWRHRGRQTRERERVRETEITCILSTAPSSYQL